MRILITGAAGFIGSNFIKIVNKKFPSAVLIVVDKLTYAANPDYIKDIPHTAFTVDINDTPDEAFEGIDYIANFSAESHVDRSIDSADAFIHSNVNGTYTLLKKAKALAPGARFVQISTDEVYGSVAYGYSNESAILNPTSPYAASKAAADHLVMSYHKTFGMDTIITRSSNNYGPNQHIEKFVPAAINNLLNRKPAIIYGRGEEQRQWIHVEDNCEGILEAMLRGKSGSIYNIGTSDSPMKNVDVFSQISRIIYPDDNPMIWANFISDPRPGHDRRYCMSCNKAGSELNWESKISFRNGIDQTIDWYKKQYDARFYGSCT